jgi:hypothetical protein
MMSVKRSVECLPGEIEVLGINCSSALPINPTLSDLGSNLGRCGGKPATKRLNYGTAMPYAVYEYKFIC